MNKKIEIPAIHDKDLKKILEYHKLWEPLTGGSLKCHTCDKELTISNLGGIKYLSSTFFLLCDDVECLNSLTKS